MEPIKYVAIRFYERNLGDHGELWQEVCEIRENETVAGLMARLPPGSANRVLSALLGHLGEAPSENHRCQTCGNYHDPVQYPVDHQE